MNRSVYRMSKELYNLLIRPIEEGGEGLKSRANVIKHLNSVNKKIIITDIEIF